MVRMKFFSLESNHSLFSHSSLQFRQYLLTSHHPWTLPSLQNPFSGSLFSVCPYSVCTTWSASVGQLPEPASGIDNLARTTAFHSLWYLALILSTLIFICWWTSCYLLYITLVLMPFLLLSKKNMKILLFHFPLHSTAWDKLPFPFLPANSGLQDFSHFQTGLVASPTVTLLLPSGNNLPATNWEKVQGRHRYSQHKR